MSKNINLPELVSAIAKESNTDSAIVEKFLKQFFSEIESNLLNKGLVKIDNLGIFKVFKGGGKGTDRILFLPEMKQCIMPGLFLKDQNEDSQLTEDSFQSLNAQGGEYQSASVAEQALYDRTDVVDSFAVPSDIASQKQALFSTEIEDKDGLNIFESADALETKKRKSNLIRISVLMIVLIALAVVFYFLYQQKFSDKKTVDTETQISSVFIETTNPDTTLYLRRIETLSETNIMKLSSHYYGDERFWGYIYEVNSDVIDDPLNIPQGVSINIPKVPFTLIDCQNEESVEIAKKLASDILMKNQRY